MIPGECAFARETNCCDCNELLKIRVCQSAAGYYIGFHCPNCGPYSRESHYFRTEQEAEHALKCQPSEMWERM